MSHVINFVAAPTIANLMRSSSFVRLIAGPVGSGKTTGIIMEMLRRCMEQIPGPDKLRRTRWAICRQTLSQLKTTVLKDILAWLGPLAEYKVSESTVHVNFGDVRSEWLLIPMEDTEDQRRLLSMQLTGAWISEGIEIDAGLVAPIGGRCGRYPSAAQGGCTWSGVLIDTNMPTEGSDWYKLMTQPPKEWDIHIQPGGMEDDAENLEWLNQTPDSLKLPVDDPKRLMLGRLYYIRNSSGNNPDWINRYVNAKYGNDPSGTAVFRETFKSSFHVVDELEPVDGKPLIIGQDFGRDPCAIIGQMDHHGRLLVLGEIISNDMGLELHIQQHLRPQLLNTRYLGKQIMVVGDPAGGQRSTLYEETSFDVLKRNGFQAFPGPTNDIDARLRAVDSFLMGQRNGGPAIIFDRRYCPEIILAMNGGYRYARMRSGETKAKPDKNRYSHPADALQYLATACHGGLINLLSSRMMRARQNITPRNISSRAWT